MEKAVVLNSATLVREARLGKQENLSGKTPESIYPWNEIFGNDLITADYSPAYRFKRRVFKTAMHVFGSGIEQTSERAGHAVNLAIEEIDSKEGQPFPPRDILESSMVVQLWDWLTSKKLQLNDPMIKQLSQFSEIIVKLVKLLCSLHYTSAFLFSHIYRRRATWKYGVPNVSETHYFQKHTSLKKRHTRQELSAISPIVLFPATKKKLLRKLTKILDRWMISLV